MTVISQSFVQDSFQFDVKARPTYGLTLPSDASESDRRAWAELEGLGITPTAAGFPDARLEVKHWHVAVRAETQRPWAEVLDQEWPSETRVHVKPWAIGDDTATLVCHAAATLPPRTDLLAAMAERLRLEGPIGEQAATAFLAGSVGEEHLSGANPG